MSPEQSMSIGEFCTSKTREALPAGKLVMQPLSSAVIEKTEYLKEAGKKRAYKIVLM